MAHKRERESVLEGWLAAANVHEQGGNNLKHYYHPMSRAVTSDWMLKELDAPHEQIIIDFTAGEQNTPEYRAINPMGKIPALVDGDVVVTESAAICAYLADKFPEKGFAPSTSSTARARYYRYLFFPGTTLEPLLAVNSLEVKDYSAVSMGFGDMQRGMSAIEEMTPEAKWVMGEDFSTADIVFGGALAFFSGFNMLKASTKVEQYVARIKARPAYQESHTAF